MIYKSMQDLKKEIENTRAMLFYNDDVIEEADFARLKTALLNFQTDKNTLVSNVQNFDDVITAFLGGEIGKNEMVSRLTALNKDIELFTDGLQSTASDETIDLSGIESRLKELEDKSHDIVDLTSINDALNNLQNVVRYYPKFKESTITDSGSVAYVLGKIIYIRLWFKPTEDINTYTKIYGVYPTNEIDESKILKANTNHFSADGKFRLLADGLIQTDEKLTANTSYKVLIIGFTA